MQQIPNLRIKVSENWWVWRSQNPARQSQTPLSFSNQTPMGPFRSVLTAMMDQLRFGTANIGGHYDSSRRAEQAVTSARHNMAQFLNCDMEEMPG